MRKGITPIIATVMVLLITVSVASYVWLNMSIYTDFYADKLISETRELPFCTQNSFTMNIVNTGNSDIILEASLDDFFNADNLLRNSNFEKDLRIDWEIPVEHIDIMLALDKSTSMTSGSMCETPCDELGYPDDGRRCWPFCDDCDRRNSFWDNDREKDDVYADHSFPDNIHYEEDCAFNDAKSGALYFLDFVDDNRDRVGVISFSMPISEYSSGDLMAELELDLGDDLSQVKARIDSLEVGQYTGIAAAIYLGTLRFEENPRDSDRVIILLTDGTETLDRVFRRGYLSSPEEEAQNAADKDIKIYSIGYGPSADNDLLEQIGIITGGNNYTAATEDELREIYQQIASDLFANIDNHESLYGNRSLRIPAIDGASFKSKTMGTGNDIIVSQYVKLQGLSSGAVSCSIHFYETQAKSDSLTPDLIKGLFSFSAPHADFGFTKYTSIIREHEIDNECGGNPCRYARIFYGWSPGSPEGDIWIDDLYMGYYVPYLEMIGPREAKLGDITIIKDSGDGDLYPYVSSSVVESNNFTYIRDANCISQNCRYIISTDRNSLEMQGTCE